MWIYYAKGIFDFEAGMLGTFLREILNNSVNVGCIKQLWYCLCFHLNHTLTKT